MQTMSYSSSDQWPQYYHHQQIPCHQQPSMPNSDTTAMDYESNLYPIESNTNGLNPNGSVSNGSNPYSHLKAPIKRKSRASKRVPTTIFNADVGNFRALVQRLTGRPRGPVNRGPVNINFSKGNADDYHNHHDVGGVRSHAMMMPLDGCNYYGSNSNNNSISRGSIKLRNDEENGGNGFVKNHQDMVLCSNNGWQNTAATSTSCGSKVDDHEFDEFDDFDVDELCLEELEWVASGDL